MIEHVAEDQECPWCEATEGSPCRDPHGRKIKPHKVRVKACPVRVIRTPPTIKNDDKGLPEVLLW